MAGGPGVSLLTGIFLVTALFFITIYFGLDKKKSYLFFFSYALFAGLSLLSLEKNLYLPFLVTSTLGSLSLLYFFASFFSYEKSAAAGIFGVILVILAVYDFQFIADPPGTIFIVLVWFIYVLSLMACSWISLKSIKENKFAGTFLFITTTVIFLLIVILLSNSFFVSSLAVSSLVLILSVSFTVFRDFKERQALIKSLQTKAVQLENEMLKKSIQPHFLMNTLTVLSEWIESQPELAVKQIELLSKEFRYITSTSGKTLTGIDDELKMCQVHLDIFNARQHAEFKLETKGIIPGTQIPPMIFHTLIENGLTHSDKNEGHFLIEQSRTGEKVKFSITSEPLLESNSNDDGLGISYIKSRLEQAFPGKWEFSSGTGNNSWLTIIEILK